MRLPAMLLAVILFAAGTASAQLPASAPPSTQTWTQYRPAGGGFTIQVPGTPKLSAQTVETSLGPIEARNATLDLGTAQFVMLTRITLSGQRLIQVIYVGAPGTETSADARRFADSLALQE